MDMEDNRERKKRKGNEITRENDKEFVKDGMTTADIRKTIQQIRAYIDMGGSVSLEDRIAKLQQDHTFFANRYPALFDMATRPDFNYEYLNYFLNRRDQIIADKLSAEEASKIVGKEWFDKFVDVSKLEK